MSKTSYIFLKTITLGMMLIVGANQLSAQSVNNGIFFQAVARDNFSNPAKERKIYVQSSVIQTTTNGTSLLVEQFQVNTDGTGMFSISIGNGSRVLSGEGTTTVVVSTPHASTPSGTITFYSPTDIPAMFYGTTAADRKSVV